ncbi:hypothetical protein [Rhodococcus sp. MEB041]|uniref:hypothetical protein n=1 Tax=Rhodococcus sp. MEB041 TaxID=3040323 RepID=UPI00254E1028|nr:hypothetical protein [Rhodococcus sp. MEB041]
MHRVTDSTLTVGGVAVDEFHPLEKTPPRRQLVVLADGTIAVTALDQLQARRAEWPTEADTDVYEAEDEREGEPLLGLIVGLTLSACAAALSLAFVWAIRAGVI